MIRLKETESVINVKCKVEFNVKYKNLSYSKLGTVYLKKVKIFRKISNSIQTS